MVLSSDRDNCNGDSHSFWPNRQFGALTGRRVPGEPLSPLFIHAREVGFFTKDKRRAHSLIERSARLPQDNLQIPKTLCRLFLDCRSHYFSGFRVKRTLTRDEDQTRSPHGLTVARE